MGRIKTRIHEIVETPREGDRASFFFDACLISMIFLSIAGLVLASVNSILEEYFLVIVGIELLTGVVFTIEYVLRIWSCTADKEYDRPITGRIRYALGLFQIIDLVALLPYYLSLFFPFNMEFLRVLRLLRLIKLGKYSKSFSLMVKVIDRDKQSLLSALSVLLIILIIASSLMFYAEHDAQPEVYSSIPAAMWWGLITLATVGYGDMVPITPLGKILGGIMALIGIGVFALPAGIIASGFTAVLKEEEEKKKGKRNKGKNATPDPTVEVCPHCGREIRPEDRKS